MRHGLIPGYNIDILNIPAGMEELSRCGYNGQELSWTHHTINYALRRWERGEESQAQRLAIDEDNHGITLACWLRVLAAAKAGAKKRVK